MMDKQHILLLAGEKALAVDSAKAGVEAAKLALEGARAALDEAKADYDASLDECEAAGIPKARARKAIEALNQVWIEAGIVAAEPADAPKDGTAEASVKETRRRRKGKAESEQEQAEPSTVAEPSEASNQEPEPVETAKEAPAAAAEPVKEVPKAPLDYSVETAEIESLIDEWCVSDNAAAAEDVDSASALLKGLLAGKSWIASNLHEEGFGIEAFRDVLSPEAAAAVVATKGLPAAISKSLSALLSVSRAADYLSWFQAILSGLEHGGTDGIASPFAPAEAEHPAAALPAADEPVEETVLEQDEQVADAIEDEDQTSDDLPDLPDFDESDYSSEAATDFDDNSSFPVADDDFEAEGTVVDDIGEIDFLNDAGEDEGKVEEPAPAEQKAPEPEKPAAPKPAFAPPAFMKRS